MKKKLILICSILLVIGCSKAEPKQDENIEVIKTTSVVEEVEIAGASYNPNVQGAEEDIAVEKVEEESKPIEEVTPPKRKSVTKTPKKTKPMIIPEPSEEEIEIALKEDVKDKVKVDEKIAKEPEKVRLSNELPLEETPEKKNSLIYIILGAVAAAGAGIFFLKKS